MRGRGLSNPKGSTDHTAARFGGPARVQEPVSLRLLFVRAVARLSSLLTPLVIAVALAGCESCGHVRTRSAPTPAHRPPVAQGIALRTVGSLPAPVQLPAAAPGGGGRALVMGGLSAADASVSTITQVQGKRARSIYAAGRPGRLAATVQHDPPRIYVPNSKSDTVDVIDQRTRKIVKHFPTGALPQHVTPSWDLKRL